MLKDLLKFIAFLVVFIIGMFLTYNSISSFVTATVTFFNTTEGRITKSSFESNGFFDGIALEYDYKVDGVEYHSNAVHIYGLGRRSTVDARILPHGWGNKICSAFPVGTKVEINYYPPYPGRSVFMLHMDWDWHVLFTMDLLICDALGFIVMFCGPFLVLYGAVGCYNAYQRYIS